MMSAKAYVSKKFIRKCFKKSQVTSAEYEKKNNRMVVSKHLTYFCYLIRLMFYQHLNSHIAYPGIPSKTSNHK